MRLPVVLLLLFLSIQATSQTNISGTVTDAETHHPLPFASVYINLTTIGVYSDEHGHFVLKNVSAGRHELVVSHVGYITSQTSFEVRDTATLNFNIRLTAVTLKEVSVTAKQDKRWKEQLKRFNLLFFGKNAQARQCKILNPWVLEFSEGPSGDFSATASANLIIENLGLGYKISYQLKKFEFTASNYTILGVTWFQEIPTYDSALVNMWARERRKAYFGSITHLLASITHKSIEKDGFELYEDITRNPDVVRKSTFTSNLNRSIAPLDIKDRVRVGKNPNQYFIDLPPKTEVHYVKGKAIPTIYRNVASPISWIEIKNNKTLEVNGSGIPMNPAVMTLSGAMSDPRIADLLPTDYDPGMVAHFVTPKSVAPQAQLLLEPTHFHTDKTFYYSGEKLWFKAYMNYSSPAYQDTLSNVLYLDLVDTTNAVVTSRLLHIDTLGVSTGSLDLSKLSVGTYQLRSSTRWMLNYDKSFIFTKTIRILGDDEIISRRDVDTVSSGSFTVTADKSVYETGDKVTLTIRTHDEEGFAFAGNVSVSVVPVNYASIAKEDPNISSKPLPSDRVNASLQSSHAIQYGIDIVGKADMKSRKKKYRQPIVMLAQEGADDLISTRANADGSFAFNGLQLYDTMKLSMQALSVKGNRRGVIKIDSVTKIVIPALPFADVKAEVEKVETPRRPVAPELSGPVQVLQEVTIESSSPASRVVGSAVHLSADITVKGEDLRNSDNGDIISMLQSRVPGLRLLTFVQGGIVRKFFRLGGIASFDSNPLHQEPIVIIDGSVISNEWGESSAEQVSRLTANMIDRIEVIKFGGGAAYGARGANGVIAIFTRTDFDKSKIVDNFDRKLFTPVRIRGYASSDTFKGYQSYQTGTTVYWNPYVALKHGEDHTVVFSVPQVTGKYAAHVEGLSADGRPLRAVCLIDVRK
ncbi:TonB-dependent receptor [Chryseolinea sp. T2]|uniref:carboxypeptidase-like regulatory domain-containing protein n=1 Tax=Chryseolinea sp. T2 TaxID=3129255 RepID=UPI00307805ED